MFFSCFDHGLDGRQFLVNWLFLIDLILWNAKTLLDLAKSLRLKFSPCYSHSLSLGLGHLHLKFVIFDALLEGIWVRSGFCYLVGEFLHVKALIFELVFDVD